MQTNTNPIQAFAFDSHAVRVVQIDGQPWFVASDVTAALCIDRTQTRRLDNDERGVCSIHTSSGEQEIAVINEPGLYSLILGSRKPEARKFKKWVTAEVLPALHRTGSYTLAGAGTDAALNAKMDQCITLVSQLAQQTSRVLELMEQMLIAIPKMLEAARPASRASTTRKKMYAEDAQRILDLVAQGYLLDDLVAETGFSQSQCYAVQVGRYKVLESGRISIDLRSDVARAADAAAKAQRTQGATA